MRTAPITRDIRPFFQNLVRKFEVTGLLPLANKFQLDYRRLFTASSPDSKLDTIAFHVDTARKLGMSLDEYFDGLLSEFTPEHKQAS